MLSVPDGFACECLPIRIGRQLRASEVIDVLFDLLILHVIPNHSRSDNGFELAATNAKRWTRKVGAKTASSSPAALGNRLRREIQQQVARRTAQCRDHQHARRAKTLTEQ